MQMNFCVLTHMPYVYVLHSRRCTLCACNTHLVSAPSSMSMAAPLGLFTSPVSLLEFPINLAIGWVGGCWVGTHSALPSYKNPARISSMCATHTLERGIDNSDSEDLHTYLPLAYRSSSFLQKITFLVCEYQYGSLPHAKVYNVCLRS